MTKQFDIRVSEQLHRAPKNSVEAAENAKGTRKLTPGEVGVSTITARNVDVAMKRARLIVEDLGHDVRSVSVGQGGVIHVVVYRQDQSKRSKTRISEKKRSYR